MIIEYKNAKKRFYKPFLWLCKIKFCTIIIAMGIDKFSRKICYQIKDLVSK